MREAASDEGTPREPSPFWDEVARLFPADDVRRATTRRPLSALTWPIDEAPTERERLRALARARGRRRPRTPARSRSRTAGSAGSIARCAAFERPTRLRHPLVLEYLGERTSFNVTELERFSDCSSAWFVDRLLDPQTIDAEVDPKLRGSRRAQRAEQVLQRHPEGARRSSGSTSRSSTARCRSCAAASTRPSNGVRMELTEIQRQELDQTLWRDLEAFVRIEAASELAARPEPLRGVVRPRALDRSAGSTSATA